MEHFWNLLILFHASSWRRDSRNHLEANWRAIGGTFCLSCQLRLKAFFIGAGEDIRPASLPFGEPHSTTQLFFFFFSLSSFQSQSEWMENTVSAEKALSADVGSGKKNTVSGCWWRGWGWILFGHVSRLNGIQLYKLANCAEKDEEKESCSGSQSSYFGLFQGKKITHQILPIAGCMRPVFCRHF